MIPDSYDDIRIEHRRSAVMPVFLLIRYIWADFFTSNSTFISSSNNLDNSKTVSSAMSVSTIESQHDILGYPEIRGAPAPGTTTTFRSVPWVSKRRLSAQEIEAIKTELFINCAYGQTSMISK